MSKLYILFDKQYIFKQNCISQIALSLGGDIVAESREGHGSQFTLTILNHEEEHKSMILRNTSPHISLSKNTNSIIPNEESKEIVFPSESAKHNLGGNIQPISIIIEKEGSEKRCDCSQILIVDDNEYNIFVLQSMLEPLCIKATIAYTGEQAFNFTKERAKKKCCQRYELIFLEVHLPVMDGIQTTRLLIEKMKNNVIGMCPIIGLTSESNSQLESLCSKAGMSSILVKPFTISDLRNVLGTYDIHQIKGAKSIKVLKLIKQLYNSKEFSL